MIAGLSGRITTNIESFQALPAKGPLTTSSCIPALGGSGDDHGLPFVFMNSSFKISFMSPAKKEVLLIPFLLSHDGILYSIFLIFDPTTFFAFAIKFAMVPVPV